MQSQNKEILAVIIIGALLALAFMGFILLILFRYQKRQHLHKKELAVMEDEYNQQILKVQFEMQEATLSEIASKLHDVLKNNIFAISISVSKIAQQLGLKEIGLETAVKQLNELSEDLQVIKEEVRLTSHSLATDRITQVGLLDAIKYEVKRLDLASDFEIKFIVNETKRYIFEDQKAIFLFRMFQETMGNIITHSKATVVNILIHIAEPNIFVMEIKDNGIGFNVQEKKKSKHSGLGLSGMYKRAIQIGADFKIISDKGQGTIVTIELPLALNDINQHGEILQNKQFNSFD